VASTSGLDRFYDTHKQLGWSVSQKVTGCAAALRPGYSDRPLQEEHYRAWFDFGVKVDGP
jgi:hypothetical protein